MSVSDLPFKAAAVVIWLPEGEEPKAFDFALGDDKSLSPPYPNPEAWWELGQAITSVRTVEKGDHKKLPWIKVGERVLSPDETLQAYEYLKAKTTP